jgi:hypothetical protein
VKVIGIVQGVSEGVYQRCGLDLNCKKSMLRQKGLFTRFQGQYSDAAVQLLCICAASTVAAIATRQLRTVIRLLAESVVDCFGQRCVRDDGEVASVL